MYGFPSSESFCIKRYLMPFYIRRIFKGFFFNIQEEEIWFILWDKTSKRDLIFLSNRIIWLKDGIWEVWKASSTQKYLLSQGLKLSINNAVLGVCSLCPGTLFIKCNKQSHNWNPVPFAIMILCFSPTTYHFPWRTVTNKVNVKMFSS